MLDEIRPPRRVEHEPEPVAASHLGERLGRAEESQRREARPHGEPHRVSTLLDAHSHPAADVAADELRTLLEIDLDRLEVGVMPLVPGHGAERGREQCVHDLPRQVGHQRIVGLVREDHDADAVVRQPRHVRREAESATVVVAEAPAVALVQAEPQSVAHVLPLEAELDRVHLVQQRRWQDLLRAGTRAVQVEPHERREVGGAGVEAARRDQAELERHALDSFLVAAGAVLVPPDLGPVERAARHAERRQQRVVDVLPERHAGHDLQDVAGEVDAEVGVAVPLPDRVAQPSLADAPGVDVERREARVVVVPHHVLVGESGAVAEQVAQRHAALGVLLVPAPDREVGEVLGDRRVQVQQPITHRREHGRSTRRASRVPSAPTTWRRSSPRRGANAMLCRCFSSRAPATSSLTSSCCGRSARTWANGRRCTSSRAATTRSMCSSAPAAPSRRCSTRSPTRSAS